MKAQPLRIKEYVEVPSTVEPNVILSFPAIDRGESFYRERTDRNIGWITHQEQDTLRRSIVCIAGAGGMGGLVAQILVRAGIGTIRIADPEIFDTSNINRQYAASRATVGKSKALETARLLRSITDDFSLVVYPQGVQETMLPCFLKEAHLVIDEIEFWNIGACIAMHQMARAFEIPLLNCLTVGFATYLHYFTPYSETVEEMLGVTLEEALAFDRTLAEGNVLQKDRSRMMRKIIECFIPDFPEYFSGGPQNLHNRAPLGRLELEGKAPILSTNPPVAAGFVADRALLYLLSKGGRHHAQNVMALPPTPGYVYMDVARLEIKTISHRS